MNDDPQPNAGPKLERIPLWAQITWVVLALFGFVGNVFGSPGASFPLHPIWSPTALAWFGLAVVGAIINRVQQFGIPGGPQLSFREREKRALEKREYSVKTLGIVVGKYSDLLQNWATTVNLLDEQLSKYGTNDQEIANIVVRFCLGRMEEAKDFMAEEGDVIRFSFWWFDAEAGGLTLLISDDIRDKATLDHIFKPGEGLCGQSYVEERYFSLRDAPQSIYYEDIPGVTPQYHGLLLMPVQPRKDAAAIGVLSIDRKKAEEFDGNARNVARALAALIAFAMNTGDEVSLKLSKAREASDVPSEAKSE